MSGGGGNNTGRVICQVINKEKSNTSSVEAGGDRNLFCFPEIGNHGTPSLQIWGSTPPFVSVLRQHTLSQNIIPRQHGQRRHDKPEDFCTAASHSPAPGAKGRGPRWKINAPRSCCTSTRALINPRWSARGQVRAIPHPSSEFQPSSTPTGRLAQRVSHVRRD